MMGTFGTVLQHIYGENEYAQTSRVPHWLSAPPLVYEEAVVNSRTRIPFETAVVEGDCAAVRRGHHHV